MMQMACLGAGVLETRSVELASKYNVPLFLGKALETDLEKGTWIMHKELEDMPITGLSVKTTMRSCALCTYLTMVFI